MTERNVDARKHAENKHPKSSFEECFPDLAEKVEEEDEEEEEEVFVATKKYKCIFNGTEMVNDAYKTQMIFADSVLEVKSERSLG